MKKKLILFVLTTLLFSLAVTTFLFITVANYQYVGGVRADLLSVNKTVGAFLKSIPETSLKVVFKEALPQSNIRVTYIDRDGKVIEDSDVDQESMENHNNRSEVIEARVNGSGSSTRFSHTLQRKMLYVATDIGDGYIIRSSRPLEDLNIFHGRYFILYASTLLAVIIITIILASRTSEVIVKPIKDLEHITERVAKGELGRRFAVFTNDEIGQLGRTFNIMAEKLQLTIKDSLEKQNRYEAILKSMDSGVIAVDQNYRVIMINPYAKKIFGIKKDIIGQYLMENIRDFEFESVFRGMDEAYKEIKILWPVERILRVRTADIISESQHIGTVAVVYDITDIKRLENMRTEFVANVSHELKTPLTSIKGFAETLRYVEDSKNKEKFLNIINDEAERLTRLINDILILSDIETHRDEKSEDINVNCIIKDIYYLMQHTADNKNIKLNIVGEEVSDIYGNSDRFKQMIINLVDNAIKYSEEGDSVFIGTKMEKSSCIIWVEDTGAGIPKENISRVFERFYRVDKARSRARGGTGLGLAIVKHIVIGFNGTIEVESEVGRGSKFTVKIPYGSSSTRE
jgi:two-component system, OmpR family, phosphate regulon sensor histidine kinase PhoR